MNEKLDAEKTGNEAVLKKLRNMHPHLANSQPRKKVNTEFDIPD